MAAIMGLQSHDKEQIFVEDSILLRSKKNYTSYCFSILRLLVTLILLSLIITICISLYKYNKGLKETFIIVGPGCDSCELPFTSPVKGEVNTSTKTELEAEIETTENYLDGGKVTEKDVITATGNENLTFNYNDHAEMDRDKKPVTDVNSDHSDDRIGILTPPEEVKNEETDYAYDENNENGKQLHIGVENSQTDSPGNKSESVNLPAPVENSQLQYSNDNYQMIYENDIQPRSSESSVYDIVMQYVQPVKDFVMRMVNRFLEFLS